jgi:hypothetical protein
MFLTLLAQDAGLEKELGELKDLNTRARLSGGETWTDPQGGDPSGCRLIGGDRDLRA